MLALIGLGLEDGDISLNSIEFLKTVDEIYLERYTAPVTDQYIKELSEKSGKEISELTRKELEDDVKAFVSNASKKNVALLIPGDPLIATTHGIILNEAKTQKIETKIFHGPSIFSAAISESGLDVYRFGPTVTIPFWQKNYEPTSFLDLIARNQSNKEHTIILCDINAAEKRPMNLDEAVSIIAKAQQKSGKEIFNEKTKVLLLGSIGTAAQQTSYLDFDKLIKERSKFSGKWLTIILPSEPTFAELESLESHSRK